MEKKGIQEYITTPEFIARLYSHIRAAAKSLGDTRAKYLSDPSKLIVAPTDIEGQNRFAVKSISDKVTAKDIQFHYDADDLVIMGGSALVLLDHKYEEKIQSSFNMDRLFEYTKVQTEDIDMVWWPRVASDKYYITSHSQAIEQMCEDFAKALDTKLEIDYYYILQGLQKYYKGVTGSLKIEVKLIPLIDYGVNQVSIYFKLKDIPYKVCEIAVHDNGSGQVFNELYPAKGDPSYMTKDKGDIEEVKVGSTTINIPAKKALVKQQALAFRNLFVSEKEREQKKALILWSRLYYLRELFSELQKNSRGDSSEALKAVKEAMDEVKKDKDIKQFIARRCREMKNSNLENETIAELCSSIGPSFEPVNGNRSILVNTTVKYKAALARAKAKGRLRRITKKATRGGRRSRRKV